MKHIDRKIGFQLFVLKPVKFSHIYLFYFLAVLKKWKDKIAKC